MKISFAALVLVANVSAQQLFGMYDESIIVEKPSFRERGQQIQNDLLNLLEEMEAPAEEAPKRFEPTHKQMRQFMPVARMFKEKMEAMPHDSAAYKYY